MDNEGGTPCQHRSRLGRILGVEIGLHYSWLIITPLIMVSLAGHFSATHPGWGRGVIWTLAVVTGLFFFADLIAHELSHAAVAKAYGLPVSSITLFAPSGMAHVEREAAAPKVEFWMGIVGPITAHEVKEVERERWPHTTVERVMHPLNHLRTVTPETLITEALETMGRQDVNQLPVVADGRLVGVISRGHIVQLPGPRRVGHVSTHEIGRQGELALQAI